MEKEEVKKLIKVHNNLVDTKTTLVKLSSTILSNPDPDKNVYKIVADKISINIEILKEMILESEFLVNTSFEKIKLVYE